MQFVLTAKARRQLGSIWRRIAQDNERAANEVEEAVFATCRMAAAFPAAGVVREEFTPREIRFLLVQPYRNCYVAYEPNSKPMRIVAVPHAAQDIARLMR